MTPFEEERLDDALYRARLRLAQLLDTYKAVRWTAGGGDLQAALDAVAEAHLELLGLLDQAGRGREGG